MAKPANPPQDAPRLPNGSTVAVISSTGYRTAASPQLYDLTAEGVARVEGTAGACHVQQQFSHRKTPLNPP